MDGTDPNIQVPVSQQDCLSRSGEILEAVNETKDEIMKHVALHRGQEKAWASLARWFVPILMALMALAGGAWALATNNNGINADELAQAMVKAQQQAEADRWGRGDR